MLKSFLIVTLRRISSNKGGAYVSLVCLTLSLAAGLFIFNHISHELSFDRHLPKVYRLEHTNQYTGLTDALTSLETANALRQEYDSSIQMGWLMKYSENNEGQFVLLGKDSSRSKLYLRNVFIAQNDLLNIFKIDLNSRLLDSSSPTIFLSKDAAQEITSSDSHFHQELEGLIMTTPGKSTIRESYVIGGLFDNWPVNSHIQFDALIVLPASSIKVLGPDRLLYQYAKHATTSNDFISTTKEGYIWRPVSEIHLQPGVSNNPAPSRDPIWLVFIGIVGAILLILSNTHYINSTILSSFDRAREIGIRKLLGNRPLQLLTLFSVEALCMNLVAGFLAYLVFRVGLNYSGILQSVFGELLSIHAHQNSFDSMKFLLILTLISSLLSSLYPAFYFSGLKIVSLLKGKLALISSKVYNGGIVVRTLIVFQIMVSVLFLSGLLIMLKQREHVQRQAKNPYDLRIKGVFPGLAGANNQFASQTYRRMEELIEEGLIHTASFSNLANGKLQTISIIQSISGLKVDTLKVMVVDQSFLQDYKFLTGSNFNDKFGFDSPRVILNKSSLERMGPWDSMINTSSGDFDILGIVDDEVTEARAYVNGFAYRTYVDLELRFPGRPNQDLSQYLHDVQVALSSPLPFFSLYLRDYEQQDKMDFAAIKLFGAMAVLAMLIAALGMVGLSDFIATRRSKEISMKKLLGASSLHLLGSLLLDCLYLVVIGAIIALPFVLTTGHSWLEDFAYRFSLTPTVIVWPFLTMLIISIMVVTGRFWKTANSNPLQTIYHN